MFSDIVLQSLGQAQVRSKLWLLGDIQDLETKLREKQTQNQ